MSFCVLVASADNRKDIFDICFANSQRIWKDCDWPRYAGFTTGKHDQYGFMMLASHVQNDWCKAVAVMVESLPDHIRYVLLMVEDTLFMQKVDAARLQSVADDMARAGLFYVRLVPVRTSWPQRATDVRKDDRLHCILPDAPYYSSTEMTLWERGYLLEQLAKPGDAWSFEHHLSRHAHWAVQEPVFDQHQIVQKGRWNWDAPSLIAKAAGLPPTRDIRNAIAEILVKTRPFQSVTARLRGHWQNLNFAMFGFTSVRLKQWMGQA